MAQGTNEHLTTALLSAYLDEELAPDELALCDAHLQTCQRCLAILADLRTVSRFLGELPEVEVPRSFALPANLTALPASPMPGAMTRQPEARQDQHFIKYTMRALSTIAAVLGIVLVLAGGFSALPRGGTATSSNTAAPSFALQRTTPGSSSKTRTPAGVGTSGGQTQDTPVSKSPVPTALAPTPPPHSTTTVDPGNQRALASSPTPAALDLEQPAGRLTIGSTLLLLGLLGIVFTRRRRDNPT